MNRSSMGMFPAENYVTEVKMQKEIRWIIAGSMSKDKGNFTLVACATRCTLTIVPFSEAVARYMPFEEKTIAANGA